MRRRALLVLGLALPILAAAAIAVAAWLVTGAGHAAARSGGLPQANQPAASAAGSSVTVSWTQSTVNGSRLGTLPGGGYTIERYPTGSGTSITPNASCDSTVSGSTATLSCTETALPAGSWQYTVTAVLAGWHGAESPKSSAVTVNAPPAPLIDSGPANPTNETTAAFTFHDGQAGVTFLCKLDAGAFVTCTSGVSYSGLAAGSHAFQVEARDAGNNTSAATSATWVVDTTVPTVAVAAISGSPTNGQPVTYAVTFSEPVTDLTAGGVTATAPAANTGMTKNVSKTDPQHFTVSVAGLKTDGSGDGTISVQVNAGAVQDTAGNTNAASNTASVTWDRTAPTVSSISRADASPTKASTLHWTVTLSEPVSGLANGNFALATSGLTGTPSITSTVAVGGAPSATWTVTVSTAAVTASNGSIGLNLATNAGVSDSAGNGLSTTSFTGQAYAFDTTAPGQPTAVSLANGGGQSNAYINVANKTSASVSVTVAEVSAADTVRVTISDGAHSVIGTAAASSSAVTVTGIDASILTDGTSTIAISAIETDAAGNQSSSRSAGTTYSKDTSGPTGVDNQATNGAGALGTITNGDVVTFTFSEQMDPGSIKSGWNGSSTTVTVVLTDAGSNDTLAVTGTSIGTVATGGNYMKSTQSCANTTMVLSGSAVSLTLGSCGGGTGQYNSVASSTMVWTPSASATDRGGNPMPTSAVTESGAPKQNF